MEFTDQNLEKAHELLSRNSYVKWNGIELESLEHDRALLSLTLEEMHKNPYGIAHGGALYTLADTACGAAARTDGRDYVTQNSSVNFISSRSEGVVLAEARVRHRGRSTCVVEFNITDGEGALLVTGMMTFFCLGKSHF